MTDTVGDAYPSPYFGDKRREYLYKYYIKVYKKKLNLKMHYLVLAAPQIGFRKLLQVPSSERYGDLTQRPGLVIHCIALETAAFP